MSLLPVLLFVLCITGCGAQTGERTTVNGKVGGSVTFTAHHGSQASEITWKIGGDKYGEVEANGPHFYRNGNRSTMDLQSGNFTINHLVKSDANDYTAEVLIRGTVNYHYFTLRVYEEVTIKPQVNCSLSKDGNYTLRCTYPFDNVTLSWMGIDNCQTAVCTIPYDKEVEVTCIARNPVSESQNTTKCPPPRKDSVPPRLRTGIIVCICLFITVPPLCITIICVCRKRKQKKKVDEQQNSPMLSKTGSNDQTNTADTDMKKDETLCSDDTPL
ncbi:SLAM family member 7-like [Discoglossus pictus]